MPENATLGQAELDKMLSVLQREQETYLPTRRQRVVYHLFNATTYTLIVVLLLSIAFAMNESARWAMGTLGVGGGLLGLTVVLFFLNLGFMRKLWKLARLRRKLGIKRALSRFFAVQRRDSRWRNRLTLLVSLLGYPLVLAGLLVIALAVLMWAGDDGEGPTTLATGVAIVVAGLSFVSMHFMRRGKERLDLVRHLQHSIQAASEALGRPDSEERVTVPAEEYNQIAHIERRQIIRDRARGIEAGVKERDSGYTVQLSREFLAAKAALDADGRQRVEQEIFRLMADPVPAGGARPTPGDALLAQVPGTEKVIAYEVQNRRVRILSLQAPTDGPTRS